MLRPRRRSQFVAGAAVFGVLYAILGLFPVSAYIGVSSVLTFREVVSPLAGMVFGPVAGGFSMVVGNFVDFAFGKPAVFDYLDFVPDLASAVMAGLVFTGRRRAALALPLLLVLWYSLDPLSADFISVGGVSVPFFWMQLVSGGTLAAVFLQVTQGRVRRLSPAYVAATVIASTKTGHIAGSILFENIASSVNGLLTPGELQGAWGAIFVAYPGERVLFTVLGTAIAVPVLRALAARSERASQG